MVLFLKWPPLRMVALVPAVLPRCPNHGRGLQGTQLPTWLPRRLAGKRSRFLPRAEQSWVGSGSGIQVWNTPKSPALNWTRADFVATLQSSDVMSFMAGLCMQTLGLCSEPCLTLPSFFPLFTSCMDHTPAFGVWAEGKRSLLFSLILLISPFSVLLAFPLPLGSRAVCGFWKWLKQFFLPWQGDAKTKHVCLLVSNQGFSHSFPSFLFSKHG